MSIVTVGLDLAKQVFQVHGFEPRIGKTRVTQCVRNALA
jgi:hypothetical protein